MEAIKSYLDQDERDYQQGVALLGQFGKNRQLFLNLQRKHNLANVSKLEYELSKLADVPTPVISIQAMESAMLNQAVGQVSGQIMDEGHAPEMKVAREQEPAPDAKIIPIQQDQYLAHMAQMTHLFNERVKLSNTLEDLQSEEEQKAAVSKILHLQESYNLMAGAKSYYDQHGHFPEKPQQEQEEPAEEAAPDLAELRRLRDNLRTRVSKAKKALVKKPGDVKKAEALAKLEVELNSLELQVKLATEAKERDSGI